MLIQTRGSDTIILGAKGEWCFPAKRNCSILSVRTKENTLDIIEACVNDNEVEVSRTMINTETDDVSTVPAKPKSVRIR